MDQVKPEEPAPAGRRERARATRLKIVKAASALFRERGFAGTTMADVARAAGVAVQTVYFVFHTKTDLLKGVYELAVMGEANPARPDMQDWYQLALAEPDLVQAIRHVVEGTGEIVGRVAPLDLAVRAAAAVDPEAAEFLAWNEDYRAQGYRDMVDFLRLKAPLRESLSPERATDIMLLLASPTAYRTMVTERGWSRSDWIEWTSAVLAEQLFGVGDGNRLTALDSG